MKICPNCEAENDDENLECFLCGFEFDDEEADSEYGDSDEESDFFDDSPEQDIDENDSADYESEENTVDLQTAPLNDLAAIFQPEHPPEFYEKRQFVSRIIPLIIILILLIGIAVIFFYNRFQDKNDLTAEIASETTETTTVSTTAKVTDTTTTTAITTETIFTESVMPESKIETISISNLSSYPQYVEILRDYNSDERCMLCDLNNDSIAELVITNAYNSILMIYTIYDGEAVLLIDATGIMARGTSISENGEIIQEFSGGASMGGVEFNRYNGGNSLDTVEYILYDESGIHHCVGEIMTDITQAQSDEILSKYKEMNLDTVPISSLDFADNVKGDYLGIGYVHVDSGGLNLRSKPNADSEVYTTIPNKASVTVYSSSTTGWYYAEYGTYKGYVSSEFITFTPDYSAGYGYVGGFDLSGGSEIKISLFNVLPIESYDYPYDINLHKRNANDLIASYSVSSISYVCSQTQNSNLYTIEWSVAGYKTYSKYINNSNDTATFEIRTYRVNSDGTITPWGEMEIEPHVDNVGDSYSITDTMWGNDMFYGGVRFDTNCEYLLIIKPDVSKGGDYIGWTPYIESLGLVESFD